MIYSKYIQERAYFEGAIATVSHQADGSNLVSIPPYPVQAEELRSDFLAEVAAWYSGKTPDDVEAALKLIFVGDSDQLGANTQTLTITAATDPQYKYLVMRRVNILDQGTGQIIGYGESENDIKNVEESPFAGQEAFFPKPAGE